MAPMPRYKYNPTNIKILQPHCNIKILLLYRFPSLSLLDADTNNTPSNTTITMVSRPQAFSIGVWNQFLQSNVSQEIICYLAQKVSNVVERNHCNQNPTRPLDRSPNVITASQHLDDKTPALEPFISSIVRQANIHVSILLTILLYLSRLRFKLPPFAKGIQSIPHRIFLACLILSEKFLDDFSLCNKDWALYSRFKDFSLSN